MRLALLWLAVLVSLLVLGTLLWPRATARAGASLDPTAAARREEDPQTVSLAAPDAAPPTPLVEAPPEAVTAELAPPPAEVKAGRKTAEVLVQVLSEEEGTPVTGVELEADPLPFDGGTGDGGERWGWTGHTDALGRARLRLAPGPVRISCPRQPERGVEVALAPDARSAVTLLLRTRADLDFHLRILDSESKEPLPGAVVRVESGLALHRYLTGATERALADEQGFAVLRLPSWSLISVEVSAPDHGFATVQLAGDHPSRERVKEVLLAPGARLEGLVVDAAGAPLPRVRVSVKAQEWNLNAPDPDVLGGLVAAPEDREWAALSRADGRYELSGLPVGMDLNLEVRHELHLVVQEFRALRLAPGEVRVRNFRVGQGGTIQGVLLDAGGGPVAERALWLLSGSQPRMFRWHEAPFARTFTDDEGRFSFESIPAGAWLCGPGPAALEDSADAALPLGQVVELPPGVPGVEVELRLPEGAFVDGRCVGLDGEPVADATVLILGSGRSLDTRSAQDGTFALGPLPPGTYELRAQGTDGHVASGTTLLVRAGGNPVLLQLRPASAHRPAAVE
jgi:hypothetical protein